jgi:hypothetical protein
VEVVLGVQDHVEAADIGREAHRLSDGAGVNDQKKSRRRADSLQHR